MTVEKTPGRVFCKLFKPHCVNSTNSNTNSHPCFVFRYCRKFEFPCKKMNICKDPDSCITKTFAHLSSSKNTRKLVKKEENDCIPLYGENTLVVYKEPIS